MLKTVRQHNIHLPLFYNDGRRIEAEKFEQVVGVEKKEFTPI